MIGRCEVSAAMEDRQRDGQPFRFMGERCNLAQLRLLLTTAALTSHDARVTMDQDAVWLRTSRRLVRFGRRIGADGISDIDPDWIEE